MNDTSANLILDALQKKGAKAELLAQARALTSEQIRHWVSAIDESAYSLEEWAESLIAFEVWVKVNGRPLRLEHKLEYLSCTAESARGGVQMPLPFLLTEFLKTNGVE